MPREMETTRQVVGRQRELGVLRELAGRADVRAFLAAVVLVLALGATPPAQSHPNRPYWTMAKLNRIAISAIVVVKGRNYLAIFLECKGEGQARVIGGKRAWKHFACTAPLNRGPRDFGRARFRLHILDAEKRFITSDGRFLGG